MKKLGAWAVESDIEEIDGALVDLRLLTKGHPSERVVKTQNGSYQRQVFWDGDWKKMSDISSNYLDRYDWREKSGYVYVFRMNEYYKIGMSIDPEKRRRALKNMHSPCEIETVMTIRTDHMSILERELHDLFADKRANGEWFALDDGDIQYLEETYL